MDAVDAVLVERVGKRFGPVVALDQVDLQIDSGGFLLLAGPNGAGKSTLLRLIAGLGRPTDGRLRVCGGDPHGEPATRAQLGLLSHHILLYEDLTALENLLFFARLYGLPDGPTRAAEALDLFVGRQTGVEARAGGEDRSGGGQKDENENGQSDAFHWGSLPGPRVDDAVLGEAIRSA